jgi:hypothetical protein
MATLKGDDESCQPCISFEQLSDILSELWSSLIDLLIIFQFGDVIFNSSEVNLKHIYESSRVLVYVTDTLCMTVNKATDGSGQVLTSARSTTTLNAPQAALKGCSRSVASVITEVMSKNSIAPRVCWLLGCGSVVRWPLKDGINGLGSDRAGKIMAYSFAGDSISCLSNVHQHLRSVGILKSSTCPNAQPANE